MRLLNKYRLTLLFWLILVIALILRVYQIDRYPLDVNGDGLAHAWAGVQILSGNQPAGMTLFTDGNPAVFWFSHHDYFDTIRRWDFRLEDPYLDQPPMLLPVIGFFPWLFGYTDFQQIPEFLIRIPAVLASGLSLALTYLLGKKLYSAKIGLLAMSILGFSPYFVFAHREAFLENFLTPIYLLALIVLWDYLQKPRKIGLILITLFSVVAVSIKITGIILPVICVFWLLKNKRFKASALVGVGSMIALIFSIGYGFIIDPAQQQWMLLNQSSRGLYLQSFLDMLLNASFYQEFHDGWYYLSFISWIVFIFKSNTSKSDYFLSVTSSLLFLVVIGTAGLFNNFNWYRYPLFPFFSLATAWLISQLWSKPSLAKWLIISSFSLANLHFFSGMWPQLTDTWTIRTLIVVIFSIPIIAEFFPYFKKWYKFCLVSLLAISLCINVITVIFYPNMLCSETGHCRIPQKMVIK